MQHHDSLSRYRPPLSAYTGHAGVGEAFGRHGVRDAGCWFQGSQKRQNASLLHCGIGGAIHACRSVEAALNVLRFAALAAEEVIALRASGVFLCVAVM